MAEKNTESAPRAQARQGRQPKEDPFGLPEDPQQSQDLRDFLGDNEGNAGGQRVLDMAGEENGDAGDGGAAPLSGDARAAEAEDGRTETAVAVAERPRPGDGAPAVVRKMPWDLVEDDGGESGYAALDMENPAYIGYVIRENLDGRELTPQDFDVVKVPAGGGRVWSVPTPDGDVSQDAVSGIIIHFTSPRAWWSVDLEDSDGHTPPDCASPDGITGYGQRRVESIVEDDGPGHHDCAGCPLNQWDTGKNGRGKACKEKRMLYLLQPDSILPMVVQAPATSIRTVDTYIRSLSKGKDPRPYWQVGSDLYLEQDRSGTFAVSRISPRRGEALSFSHVNRMISYRDAIREVIDSQEVVVQQDAADQ